MTYELNRNLFIENGAAVYAAANASIRNSSRFRAWRKLNPEKRLKAVERALGMPANDVGAELGNGLCLAL
ncbi:MAG TPA: hypothetical protein VMK31_01970 [Sphingomicrobium sp.]|nr:hypothetical protein [Sphingomicrobium sp.]